MGSGSYFVLYDIGTVPVSCRYSSGHLRQGRVLGSDRQYFFLESQESSVKNPKPLRICLSTDSEQPFDNPGWIESSS